VTEGATLHQILLAKATLEDLHGLCRTTAAVFREAHEMSARSHEHSQKLMVWLGGLMGVGIFSVYGLLAAAPQSMRLTVLVPWTAGILCSTLAGLLNGEVANRNDKLHFDRISLLDLLLLQRDKDAVLKNFLSTLEPEAPAMNPEVVAVNRWLVATNTAFYLAHILFVVGAVAAATTVILLGR